jgi:hypothetical protein
MQKEAKNCLFNEIKLMLNIIVKIEVGATSNSVVDTVKKIVDLLGISLGALMK